jgi:HAD superfamily hydrolase (TIGR01509 family)
VRSCRHPGTNAHKSLLKNEAVRAESSSRDARVAARMRRMAIEAVLFDSGGVLIGPKGGRWNPRSDFESNLDALIPGLAPDAVAAAIAVGDAWLSVSPTTEPYRRYYEVILAELGIELTDARFAALMPDVDPSTIVEPYPEVLDVVAELRRRDVRMAVVSDAWPSLPTLHAAVGLVDCFEVYAISAVLGCTKPDPRMYRHASDGLGLDPSQCLFVDDVPELVAAAIELGYEGAALCRAGADRPAHVPSITDLTEVLDRF